MSSVFRESEDGLSRERWDFRHTGQSLVLQKFSIERREKSKGRFKMAGRADRWEGFDERKYNSGLARPTEIPMDVIRDAVAFDLDVYIGWTNLESRTCVVNMEMKS